mmetsp:Transcript_15339/g.36302  ORF Transcript_15339/g.36302 Transcript_15339/m.36302 type:complete len:322 (-) Transcript_15339:159-1124(-)
MPHGGTLAAVLNRGRHTNGSLGIGVKRGSDHCVGSAGAGEGVGHELLDRLRHLPAARKEEGAVRHRRHEAPLLRNRAGDVSDQSRIQTLLAHLRQQELHPPVHVLRGVGAAEDQDRNAELDVAKRLAAEVQEIGEVGNAADKGRLPLHANASGQLVLQEQVVQLPFDHVGLQGLLDLRDAILLVEVQSLIADQGGGVLREQPRLQAADAGAEVLANADLLHVGQNRVHGLRRGQHLLAVDASKGVQGITGFTAFHAGAVDEGGHRVVMPRFWVEALNVLDGVAPQGLHVYRRLFPEGCSVWWGGEVVPPSVFAACKRGGRG